MRIRGGLKLQRSTSLEHIGGMKMDLAVFDMMVRKKVDERSKGSPKPMEASGKWDEMSPTRNECRQVPCSRATYCRHDNDAGSIFPHHFWRVPQLFLITSLKGIAYACDISPPFGRIHPGAFNESQEGETRRTSFRLDPMSSGFNESEKGRTRRLFMFREFEKTAEK